MVLSIPCSACTCRWSGDCSEGETPVPIPNTAVKLFSPDDTVGANPWENRTLPLHPPVWAGFSFWRGSKTALSNDLRLISNPVEQNPLPRSDHSLCRLPLPADSLVGVGG